MPLRQVRRPTSQIRQRLSQALSHCFSDVLPCRHILRLARSGKTDYYISNQAKTFYVDLQLPAGLACDHCVFQVRSALPPMEPCLPSTICISCDAGASCSAPASSSHDMQYLRGTCATQVCSVVMNVIA